MRGGQVAVRGAAVGNRCRVAAIVRGPSVVERTANTEGAAVEHVGVDHGRADVVVTEQHLDRADVGSGFEQVRGEAVAEGVTGGAAVDARGDHGGAQRLLHGAFVQVMQHEAPGLGIDARSRRGEDVLPGEARRGAGHLAVEGEGKVDFTTSEGERVAVTTSDEVELRAQSVACAGGEERGAVVRSLSLTHDELVAVEVDVFHAERERLVEP